MLRLVWHIVTVYEVLLQSIPFLTHPVIGKKTVKMAKVAFDPGLNSPEHSH